MMIKTASYTSVLFCIFFLLAQSNLAIASKQEQESTKNGSTQLEVIVKFPDSFKLIGIAVSKTGRIFASAPSCAAKSNCVVEVNPKTGDMTPYPNVSWNRRKSGTPSKEEHTWIQPQAMWVDRGNHLWVLDRSEPMVKDRPTPKLVEFDLNTNKSIREYSFEGTTGFTYKDYLNDFRIDLRHRYAYLTNTSNKGGLVVLNLDTGKARQVLAGDPSTFADPNQHLMFGTQIAKVNGKPWVVHSDGIALSPDNQWLYYRPLTDHTYWRIPTTALIDRDLSPAELASAKEYLGYNVMSGGMIMSDEGVLYVGDLEEKNVTSLTPVVEDGNRRLKSSVFADSAKLAWADGFAIYNHYLYIADSHLNELIFDNGYPRAGDFTIFRVELPSAQN
jgi:sugar lactone lactonase YvrE